MDTLQAVAEPRRRRMLQLVWDSELSAGEIADEFDITFGAVSQHLAVLRDMGLVSVRQDGNHRYYRTRKENLGPLRQVLEDMWSDSLDELVRKVESDERQ